MLRVIVLLFFLPLTVSGTGGASSGSLSTMDSNSAIERHDQSDSCTATALTTGVISAITTALLVAAVSMAIHILINYQCIYKPKLMIRNASYCTSHDPDAMYDVVNERPGHGVGAALEMRENEAYGV